MVDLMDIRDQLNDKTFRNELRANPKEVLAKFAEGSGWIPDDGTEFVVVTNTKDISYIAIPHHKAAFDESQLASLAAAADLHFSTLGCVSTASSFGACVGCALSISSAGSVEVKT